MKYPIKYITAIAEYTLGSGNSTAIGEYVKNFDPTLPKYIADEKKFLSEVENEKKISEQRQKLRETNYIVDNFIYDFYRYNLFNALRSEKTKGIDEKKYDTFNLWVKNAFSEERKEVDESLSYAETANNFMNKYSINVNVEGLVSTVQGIAMGDNKHWTYANYYKLLFQAYYQQANKDNVKIEEFCKDFENMISSVRKAETGKNDIPSMAGDEYSYGVMKSKDLKKFLCDIKKEEFNYTKHAREVVVGMKGEEIPDLYRNLIRGKLELEDGTEEDRLRYCMAHVNALKEHFNSRPRLYRITSFFKSRKEAGVIAEMQKLMIETFGPEKVAQFKDVKEIYSEEYDKACEGIDKFCDKLSENELKRDTEFELNIEDDEVEVGKREEMVMPEQEVELKTNDEEVRFSK